jgi:O-antigen/teichoic acid export membrane protein
VPLNKVKSLLKDNTLHSKIAKGIAWSFLGTMISKMMMILVFVIIARIITVEEYGEVGILRNVILTFSMIALASFGITATRYIATYIEKDIDKTNKILTLTRISVTILSFLISFLIYFLSNEISLYLLNNLNLESYVEYLSVAIFFTSLNGYQNGVLAGLEKFKEISYINIINGLTSFPILLIGAYYWKVEGIMIGLVLTTFILWLYSFYYLGIALKKANLKSDFKFKKEFNSLVKFTLPSFISGLMLTPTFFIINSMLAHQENGYIQLGIFSAAFFFATLSRTLIQILGQVLYPYAMKEFGKENKQFEYINNMLPWFVGIIINLPLIIFPEVFSLLFGEKYMNNDFYLSLIFIAMSNIIIAHRQGISRNFAAANIMWWSVLSNMFWSIATILFSYFLIEKGSIGLSVSLFLGYLINSIIFIPFYLNKKLITKEMLYGKSILIVWIFTISFSFLYFLFDSYVYKLIFLFIIFLFLYIFKTKRRSFNV